MREVRKVRWFDGFDFHALREGHLIAPYVPEVRGEHVVSAHCTLIHPQIRHATDASNFDSFGADNEPPPEDDTSGWDIDF